MPESKRNPVRTRKAATPSDAAKVPMDFAVLSSSVGFSLRRAQMSTFQEFTAAMEKHGIRPSQFAVLVLIRSNPGLKQTAISKALGIQKANFVALLDRLEKRGLTERRKVRRRPPFLCAPSDASRRNLCGENGGRPLRV